MEPGINSLLTRMRDDFIAVLPERCDRIEASVLAFEHAEAGAFDELFRLVHSLKGSGGTYGFPVVSMVCHQFESFLSEAQHQFNRSNASFAFDYVDLLRAACVDVEQQRRVTSDAEIAGNLERLRKASMRRRAAVLLVVASAPLRRLCNAWLETLSVRVVSLEHGLPALDRLLREPFDLLVASRELRDLNALAVIAAVRESGSRNQNIPVILISGNVQAPPAHLRIHATINQSNQTEAQLRDHIGALLKTE